jgi:hypothetical protein
MRFHNIDIVNSIHREEAVSSKGKGQIFSHEGVAYMVHSAVEKAIAFIGWVE